MSRRTVYSNRYFNLINKVMKRTRTGSGSIAELILTDFINIACNGLTQHGAGSLIINLQNDSTTYMSGHHIEEDLRVAEREEDTEVYDFMLDLLQRVNDNDWSKNVLITLISDAGTRTFAVEAGRSQESLRALSGELT